MRKVRFTRGMASTGLKLLTDGLRGRGVDVKRTKLTGSRYMGHPSHLIINWGATSRGRLRDDMDVLNRPSRVSIASDKLKTLQALERANMDLNIPRFTTSSSEASSWLSEGSAERIYCRTLTRASQGRGIEIATVPAEIVSAGLYTEGVDVDRELRLHVFQGEVIDFAQKKRMGSERREADGVEVDEFIRNHGRGWIFAREGVEIPDIAKEAAIEAINTLGLDFGAVDLVISNGIPKILEVNTAPGLEGTTLERYVDAVHGLCQMNVS